MKKSPIVSNPKILGGKPVIPGTRIAVEFVLELLSSGWSYQDIMNDYDIKEEDILEAINFAKNIVASSTSYPLTSHK